MQIEEVVVTGTHIKGKSQFDSPSPIAVIGADQLNNIGASNVADLVQTLTINTGSQNNPDAFTQNGTTGTSNFNLRGLGVASTLVLLNGRRQVVGATTTNDGIAFVDTSSLVPQIAVQRVEIVKDGAAAIYGTDAVAGVVNFITDDSFQGVQLSGKWQGVTNQGSQDDYLAEGKFGFGNDNTHVMGAFSYYSRTPLTTAERRLSQTKDDSSVLGNPGAYYLPGVNAFLASLGAGAAPVIDPTGCESAGGQRNVGLTLYPGFDLGTCGFDFGSYYNLVPKEHRTQAYLTVKQDLGDGHTLRLEGGYAYNDAIRNNSPTFPYLQLAKAVVPAYHPDFPAAFLNSPFWDPTHPYAIMLGRAIGNGGTASPNKFYSTTARFNIDLTGPLGGDWTYDVAFTMAGNHYNIFTNDVVTDRFQRALMGYGGRNCDRKAGVPGQNGCEFYNPFATSFTTAPNSQSVMDYIIGRQEIRGISKTQVFDAVASGTVGHTGAGDIGLAIGMQVRGEQWSRDYDNCSNRDCFAFIIGNQDFGDNRTAKAVFLETSVPLTEQLDLSLAARHESYGGGIGSTTNPKVSLLFHPNDKLSLRGSYSTSFRAPSVYQVSGTGTSLNQVVDPLGGTAFAAIRSFLPSTGTRDLKPEKGRALNFGISWQPTDGLDLSIDYWNYTFKDVIIQENYQSVVNDNPTDPTRVVRAFGTSGSILMVLVDYVNASSVKTDGFDFSAKYRMAAGSGTFMPFVDATYVNKYDLEDPQAGTISGAGNRNFTNFGSPTPRWRSNFGAAWVNDVHDIRFYVRYMSGVTDDQNPGSRVGAMTTVDAQYTLNLGGLMESLQGTSLQVGVINAFDKAPPYVSTNGGFESKLHDPRGRMAYVKLTTSF
ncbi:TonB-dependent receptor domain-containing protein [Kordiimonas marina]|uniref:TonB-dependent receptor domain-containing protein n=1 Tax=Kordiimonas marina TaxID=2872312 RepID=UPI001FF32189|nr:TonB-dependent receptor [Kordiimonas marina]MCJ9428085.1 TonB-dependent receptor [Kordiimonas marina]